MARECSHKTQSSRIQDRLDTGHKHPLSQLQNSPTSLFGEATGEFWRSLSRAFAKTLSTHWCSRIHFNRLWSQERPLQSQGMSWFVVKYTATHFFKGNAIFISNFNDTCFSLTESTPFLIRPLYSLSSFSELQLISPPHHWALQIQAPCHNTWTQKRVPHPGCQSLLEYFRIDIKWLMCQNTTHRLPLAPLLEINILGCQQWEN